VVKGNISELALVQMSNQSHIFKINFEQGIVSHNEYNMKFKKYERLDAEDTLKVLVAEGNVIIWVNNSFYGVPFHDPILDNEEFVVVVLMQNKGD